MVSFLVFLLRAIASVLRADDANPASLDEWKHAVRARFPKVTQLPTSELAAWLADTNRPRPILLDVRTPAEFRVGHLPGAIRVDPSSNARALLKIPGDHHGPYVVYCSVGWRSSILAGRLAAAGFTNVANLEGSVFAWANEDRPLEADGHPVSRVHPYNRVFGRLLRRERRADP